MHADGWGAVASIGGLQAIVVVAIIMAGNHHTNRDIRSLVAHAHIFSPSVSMDCTSAHAFDLLLDEMVIELNATEMNKY